MALTQYTADTDIIETLGTNPEDRPTLTDDTFKAKFDENAANIKAFLNAMIAELLSTANGKGASQIGIEDSGSKFTATNIEAALAESATLISTHTGELISEIKLATRDLTVAGTQTITFTKVPKALLINGVVGATKKASNGEVNSGGSPSESMTGDGGLWVSSGSFPIVFYDTTSLYTYGAVVINADNTITITWTKVSTGATGTASLRFTAFYH